MRGRVVHRISSRGGARIRCVERSRARASELHFVRESAAGCPLKGHKNPWYAGEMQRRYRLGGLGNDELLAALVGRVRRENDLMSDLLAHLAELDERRFVSRARVSILVCVLHRGSRIL